MSVRIAFLAAGDGTTEEPEVVSIWAEGVWDSGIWAVGMWE